MASSAPSAPLSIGAGVVGQPLGGPGICVQRIAWGIRVPLPPLLDEDPVAHAQPDADADGEIPGHHPGRAERAPRNQLPGRSGCRPSATGAGTAPACAPAGRWTRPRRCGCRRSPPSAAPVGAGRAGGRSSGARRGGGAGRASAARTPASPSTSVSVDRHRAGKNIRSICAQSRRATRLPNGAALVEIQASETAAMADVMLRLRPIFPAAHRPVGAANRSGTNVWVMKYPESQLHGDLPLERPDLAPPAHLRCPAGPPGAGPAGSRAAGPTSQATTQTALAMPPSGAA